MTEGVLSHLSEIEATLQEAIGSQNTISVKQLFEQLMSGDLGGVFQTFLLFLQKQLSGGLYENQQLLFKIAGLAVIGAIFTNFAMAFSKDEVAQTGFYLTYTLLMTLLMSSFVMTAGIVTDVLHDLMNFIKVLVPTFCVVLAVTSGKLLSAGYYQLMMIAIAVSEWLMSTVLLRLIQIYILIALVNQISKEDYLSKFAELLEIFIKWGIRTIVGVVLGINTIQTILLPALDRAKETLLYRMISAVPGVGDAANTAAGAVIGSTVLIRNVLGMGSLIILCLICLMPVVRVCIILLSYKVVQAIIQPVSDKRLIEGIESIVIGGGMLLRLLLGCILMFILSLAIVCNASTMMG